jgi:plastocyanin
MRRAAALAVLSLLLVLPGAGDAADGDVRGRVELGVEGLALASVAPVVVYLERLDGRAGPPPTRAATMNQRDARFSPSFLVVAAGQPLHMANDDVIYHNVFSYSRPNDFDLGLYPAGESRTLTLGHAGVVKIYCSIHESMNATILVSPTRWFDTVGAGGAYALPGVAPGRYRAFVWSERLPLESREVEVWSGQSLRLDWRIGTPSSE